MTKALKRVGDVEVDVPKSVLAILGEGLVQEDGCLLLAYYAASRHPPRSAYQDDTGYEALVNRFFVDALSVDEAVLRGIASFRALVLLLVTSSDQPCKVILGIDAEAKSADIRFHVKRLGEDWLAPDLDGYDEPVMVVDVGSNRTLLS